MKVLEKQLEESAAKKQLLSASLSATLAQALAGAGDNEAVQALGRIAVEQHTASAKIVERGVAVEAARVGKRASGSSWKFENVKDEVKDEDDGSSDTD